MTLYILAEQIRKQAVGDKAGLASKLKMDEVRRAACQVANKLLKIEQFSTMNTGEMIPQGSVIAEYDNLPVVDYKNVAKVVLPVAPVRLPRGMGVWHVSRCDDVHNPFIPSQNGMIPMVQAEPLINEGLGIPIYEVHGLNIVFDRDVLDNSVIDPIVDEVFVRLVVTDISELGEFDPLPFPSDMEADVIRETAALLFGTPPADKITDPTADKELQSK